VCISVDESTIKRATVKFRIATVALALLKLAALRFDFYSGMVLLLSVIVLSCNVLSCIFSAPVYLCVTVEHFNHFY